MLDTRMPSVAPTRLDTGLDTGTLPRPAPRAAPARPPLVRERPPVRPEPRRTGRSRMARSEARLLAFAVAGCSLMCAVLVIYLAAYAHVCQLGLEQSRARADLRVARQKNDVLQAELARLQCPARVAARAEKMGMTLGGRHATYLSMQDTADADDGSGRGLQGMNGGTSADGGTSAAFDH